MRRSGGSRMRGPVAVGLAIAASLLASAGTARAQQVGWVASGPLGVGQIQKLDLLFEDCQPEGAVSLPEAEGLLVVGEPTESRSFSMVNFKSSSSVTLSYPVRATRPGEIRMPAFEVDTSQGRMRVAEVRLRAAKARLPGAGVRGDALEDVVQVELRASESSPYVGEVVDVELLIGVEARGQASLAGPPRWTEADLLSEGWGEAEQIRLGGRSGVRIRNRVQLSQPGPGELPAVEQELNIETGGRGLGLFFSRQMASVVVATEPVPLTVRPLPEPAAPGFTGAVGRFELESKLVPEHVTAGEPVTWTLRLSGRGNWPDGVGLPARAVPHDLRAIQPRSQRDFPDAGVFEGSLSEDVVLIPERAGVIDLAPVRFVYFDPDRERYEVIEVGPLQLTVLPAAAGGTLLAPPAPGVAAVPAPAFEAPPSALPDAEPRLPRDLLAAPTPRRWLPEAATPLPRDWLVRLSLAPGAFVGLAWLALALRRARARDPLRPRRLAREATLAAIDVVAEGGRAEELRGPLLRWQQQAAILLGLGHAAPGALRVEAGAPEADPAWAELWRESERAIHGPDAALAADWAARAGRAARRLTLPQRWPRLLLQRGSWLPSLLLCGGIGVLVAAAVAGAPSSARAGDPLAQAGPDAAYREGRFAEAEAGYREQVARDPSDWRARYNLALARAQQGDRAEALAQATAAFVLQPRDPSVRWNLALFARETGAIDPQLRELAFGAGTTRLSRGLSVRRWQTVWLLGAGLLWSAAVLALARRFRGARGRPLWPAAAIAGAALLASAWLALAGYGDLADAGAAMLIRDASLRSLPSEAEGVGIARELPSGQVVRLRRELLAWVEVELANGERGWLRRSSLAPFYLPALAPVVADALSRPPVPPPPSGGAAAT